MANEKMSWTEFKKLVAQNANCSAEDTTKFLDVLTEVLVEGLQKEKQVKIKGLGTFTLKTVAPRKSVNISTGESFVIDGYNKIIFTTEAAMKESVEKRLESSSVPNSGSDTALTPIQKLSDQANEIVDLLSELGQAPSPDAPAIISHPQEEDEPAPEEEPLVEEGEPTVEEESVEETPEVSETPEEKEEEEEVEEEEEEEPAKKRCNHFGIWLGVVCALLLVTFGIYYRGPIQIGWKCFMEAMTAQSAGSVQAEETEVVVADTVPEIEPVVALRDIPRTYTEYIAQERVPYGSRLAWLSYKYYGAKDLWVFIYEANRETMVHPNHLKHHQLVRIPKLDPALTDLTNPEVRALVDELSNQYLHP